MGKLEGSCKVILIRIPDDVIPDVNFLRDALVYELKDDLKPD